eukprot:SAG31_NODE_1771_length_7309_cov_4.269626_4_plen_84_part_00
MHRVSARTCGELTNRSQLTLIAAPASAPFSASTAVAKNDRSLSEIQRDSAGVVEPRQIHSRSQGGPVIAGISVAPSRTLQRRQ